MLLPFELEVWVQHVHRLETERTVWNLLATGLVGTALDGLPLLFGVKTPCVSLISNSRHTALALTFLAHFVDLLFQAEAVVAEVAAGLDFERALGIDVSALQILLVLLVVLVLIWPGIQL